MDGFDDLIVRMARDVPSFDDGMIRGPLTRSIKACERLEALDTSIHRVLWSLGYVAQVERATPGSRTVLADIEPGR